MSSDRKTKMELITVKEAVALIGLTREGMDLKDPERCVRGMIRRGELRGMKIAGRQMVDRLSIDALLTVKAQ